MPKVYKSRRSVRPRLRKNRRKTPAKAAYTALRMVKQIRRAEEIKKADMTHFTTPIPIDQLGYVFNLSMCSQGSSQYTRIGLDVLAKYVSLKGVLNIPTAAVINARQVVRFIVFTDRQEVSSTTPALTELLETTGTNLAPYSLLNRSTVGRFNVLRDFNVTLTQQYPIKPVKINLSFKKPHKIRFRSAALSDNQRNSIWVAIVSDIPMGSNNPTFQATSRFGFSDD